MPHCGSKNHLVSNFEKITKEEDVNFVHDLEEQIKYFGLGSSESSEDSDEESTLSFLTNSSGDDEEGHYVEQVRTELNARSDFHDVMGEFEVLYTDGCSDFKGVLWQNKMFSPEIVGWV